MAGDWIKMRTNLQRNPRVLRIASALNADRLRVIGGLHAVWSLADEQTEDGRLDAYSFQTIDEMIGWSGFCKALNDVDWIHQDERGVTFPRFDEHNGASAKRRAQEADRKRSARASAKASASQADKKRTREEKRRDKNIAFDPIPYLTGKGVPEQVITDWLELRKTKKAKVTLTAIDGIEREAQKISLSLAEALKKCCERGWQGFDAEWVSRPEQKRVAI